MPVVVLFRVVEYATEVTTAFAVNEDGIVVGEIVNVCADERVLDENGKIDTDKVNPIVFDSVAHTYRKLGEKVGTAFSDGNQLK